MSAMMTNTLIVGGGPAGLAPLLAASRNSQLDRIMAAGLAIAERGPAIGRGRIGNYAINSDSTGNTLVSGLLDNPHPVLANLWNHPTTKAVAAYGVRSVPLALVGELMAALGVAFHEIAAASGNPVLLGHEALHTKRTSDGLWQTRLRRVADGSEMSILSHFVVLATGGHQPQSILTNRYMNGRPLLPTYAGKLIQSDTALTAAGLDAIGARLAASRNRRIAIIGSSSSAMACANALLRSKFGPDLGEGAVTLLHRRPLRVFFPSAAEALSEGYDEFGAEDICPVSGFVFRFAGFRLESRELVMAVRGIGGRPPEKRLRLHRLASGSDPAALSVLDEAEVIVAALGYRPRALPVLSASGRPISLFADDPAGSLVDGECRVLDAQRMPLDGLLGIGLAAGFSAPEKVGGEPSFSGQTNSLWQWQNDVGALIARQIHAQGLSKSVATAAPKLARPLSRAALSEPLPS